ncbi:MAG: ATP-binding protein [Solidesulfovibrio sp.]
MLPIANSSYFHDLLNSFSAGVVIVNIMGLVYASNTAATALLGFTPEELADKGRSAAIIARADNPRAVARFLAAPLKHAKKPSPLTLMYRHPDGANRNFRLSGSLLVENEKIFGILIEISDVTEIFTLHDRERTMLLGIQAAQRERIESLGRFSLAVAHQIRNPLMIIGGFASRLLRKRAPDDPEAEALSMILDGAKRLEAVVRAVSEYARRRDPAPVMAAPADLASRAMDMAQTRTGVRARLLLNAGTDLIHTDADLVVEALAELLANALEASVRGEGEGRRPAPPGREIMGQEGVSASVADAKPNSGERDQPAISVTFRRKAGDMQIAVEDRGPGLPEDIRPFIFDPFFTTKAVGVGMGLSIAKRNAEDLGGTLVLTPGAPIYGDDRGDGSGCLAVLTLPDASRPWE